MKSVKVRKKLLSVLFCVLVLCATITVISFQSHSIIKEISAEPTTYWVADTEFNKFANGKQYKYSTPDGEETVTVNSSATYGTINNPYVITNPKQWALFAQKVNSSAVGYFENSSVYVLDSDLDMGGFFTEPIGNTSTGFMGSFYGQKHMIQNAQIKQNSSTIKDYVGLFCRVYGSSDTNNAKISDIAMDKSCQIVNNLTDEIVAAGTMVCWGGICATSKYTTFVNCSSNMSMTLMNESEKGIRSAMGGISGETMYSTFFKCTVRGKFTIKGNKDGATALDNSSYISGIARMNGHTTIKNCFVEIIGESYNGGPNIGGITSNLSVSGSTFIVENCYIDFTAITHTGASPDIGGLIGLPSGVTMRSGSMIKNIYLSGGSSNLIASSVGPNQAINCTADQVSGIYSSAEVMKTNGSLSKSFDPLGSEDALYHQAQTDLNKTGDWNLSDDGLIHVKGEPTSVFDITYDLNGGTQAANAATQYKNTVGTALPTPTKPGFSFNYWALNSKEGKKITSIAAGTSGDLNLFAVWTINDLTSCTVTANKTTVTYGETITLTAKGEHAASGVRYAYQWYKGTTAISDATSATLARTTVADSGTYKCKITATADGQSKAKDSNTVTITINKATPALTAPTVTYPGTAYVGQTINSAKLTLKDGSAKNGSTAVAGTFSWTNSTAKIDNTNKGYSVTFTPADTANYNANTINVTVNATQLTVKFRETFKNTTKDIKTVNVDYGSTLAKSSFPTFSPYAGYTGAYDVTADLANITANKTVTARYTANTDTKYKVYHFRQNIDGTYPATPPASDIEDKKGTTDTTATATAKTYTGFTYAPDATGTKVTGNIDGEGTLVLKLYYTRNNYTVTYNLNGGTGTGSASVAYDDLIKKPNDPANAGYTFGGWYTDAALGTAWNFTADKMPADNVTLYAKWTLKAINANTVTADKPTTTYGEGKVTLTATATHDGTDNGVTLAYKWYKNNKVIAGETAATLVLDGLAADSGAYKCEVTATDGTQTVTKTSNELTVTVNKADLTLTAPAAAGVYVGQHLTDSALTGGTAVNEAATDPAAAVTGSFAWTNVNTEVRATGSFSVTFTPDDTDNYNTATVNISVTATQLTVKFVDAYDDNKVIDTKPVDYGSTLAFVDFPVLPTHVGYTGVYDVTADIANITANKTVTATYTANTDTVYTVLHIRQNTDGSYSDDGGLTETEKLTGTTGEQVTAATKSYEGFAFDSGKTGSQRTGNIAGDGALVLKVYYERKAYDLYMNLKGGSGVNSATVLYGCPAVRPADPTRNGYKFTGWYKDEDYTNLWRFSGTENADLITANTTIYAKWEAEEYKIAYTHNRMIGGAQEVDETQFAITPADNPQGYTVLSPSFVLNAPTAEGYTFLGWYVKDSDIKITQIVTGTTGALELEARWTPADYVVRFDAQGGKASFGSTVVKNLDTIDRIPTATKAGAEFIGWYPNKDGSGVMLTVGAQAILKYDVTYYAAWKDEEYRISFEYILGELSVTKNGEPFDWESRTVKTGDVLKFSVTPPDGYSLVRLKVNGGSLSNNGNFIVKSGYADKKIVITTQTRLTTYTITYYLNGGRQGTPPDGTTWATQYTVESEDIELPPEAFGDGSDPAVCPTKTGYYFTGWFTDKEMTDLSISVIEKGTTGNISLYADWTPSPQTIIFRGNYGGAKSYEQTGTDGLGNEVETDAVIKLNECAFKGNDARQDFKFLGWSTTPNGAVEYKDEATDYKVKPYDNVLYAVWHVANMQFVDITVTNDKMVYGSNKEGIVLTPAPGYAYTSDDVTLTYQWYRLNTNGVYVKYGEPITLTASELKDPAAIEKTSIHIHEVADCGTFKCTLEATGTTTVDSDIVMVSTDKGEGTRTVSMEKMDYTEINFGGQTFVYDGKPHSIELDNTTLPAGITVSYTGNGVIKAGEFEVIAVFTVPDTSNYKPIDSRVATLKITPKKITAINFIGADKDLPASFSYTYNGNPYTVTAALEGVLDGDEVRASLTDNSFTAAGSYTALVAGIEGADSGNYELDPSLKNVSRSFTINKATYDTSSLGFANKSVTYNNAPQSIVVTGLPAGVSVAYSYSYTPFSSLTAGSGAGNSGTNAGTYIVTAVFTGDADNYNVIPSMQATLLINKANYTPKYGNFTNSTVSYMPGAAQLPPTIDLAGLGLADKLDVSYAYYTSANGQFTRIELGSGFVGAGVYRIDAQLTFLNAEDINNYNTIPEKSVIFNITSLVVKDLHVVNYSETKYKVGDSFDPNELSVTAIYEGGADELLDSTLFTVDPVFFTKAGQCVITVSYMDFKKMVTITVEKGDHDLSNVSVDNTTRTTYDKQGHLPELVGELPAGVTAEYAYCTDGGKTYEDMPAGGLADAGTYKIRIGFVHNDPDNYNPIVTELTCTLVIERAEIEIVFGESEFVYDGTEHVLTAKGLFDGEEITLTLTGNKATDADEYTALVTLDESYTNFKLPAIGTSKVWTIAPQTVTVGFVTPDAPYVYNGSEHTVRVTVKDANGNAIDAQAVVSFGKDVKFLNAGEYTATVVGLLNADGSACVNYRLPDAAEDDSLGKVLTILPDTVEAVWEVNAATDGGENWVVYDPDAKQLVYTGALLTSRVRAGFYYGSGNERVYHGLTLNFNGESFVNAGRYAVTATGSDANFTVSGGAMTIAIAPKETQVFFEVKTGESSWQPLAEVSLAYKGHAYEIRAYYLNNAGGRMELTLTVTREGVTAEPLHAGAYTLTGAFIYADANYILTGATAVLTIGRKEITIDWTDPGLMYDGTEKTVTATIPDAAVGDDITLNLTNNKKTQAGEYTATATLGGAAAADYEIAAGFAEHTFTIAARSVTVTIDDVRVKYSGLEPTADELASAVKYRVTSGEVISGESLQIAFVKEAGVNVREGGYAITGSSANGNYKVTFAGNYAADTTKGLYVIEKADPTVEAFYDGTLYEGDKLSGAALALKNGGTAGTIVFDDISASMTLTPGEHGFVWTFTPDDTDNYNTKTGTITIAIVAVVLEKIEVTTQPNKVSYMEEMTFNAKGIVVTAYYNNGVTKPVQNSVTYSINGEDALTHKLALGDNTVIVTYESEGVTKTCELSISVTDKVVEKLEIVTPPAKLTYVEGQTFTADGLTIKVTYVGGLTDVITEGWVISPNVALKTSDTKVTVTYGEKTVEIPITVVRKAVEKIEIATAPDKTEYIEGTAFDPAGLTVTATYNDGTTETLGADALGWSNEPLALGDTAVRISYDYGDNTAYAEQSVTVVAKKITSIAVTKAPNKTVYDAFTRFDRTGMIVTATYDNGTTGEITDYAVAPGGELTVDVTTVTVKAGDATATVDVTVKPVAMDMSGVALDNKTYSYDGKAHGIAVTGLPAGVTVLYKVNGGEPADTVSVTEIGTYTVEAVFATDDPNYLPIGSMRATLTISELLSYNTDGIGIGLDAEITYNGEARVPHITGSIKDADGKALAFGTAGIDYAITVTKNGGEAEIFHSGVYTVTVTFGHGNVGYAPIDAKTFTVTVGKAELTLTADDAEIFAGQEAPMFTYTLTGFLGADTAGNIATTGEAVLTSGYVTGDAAGEYAVEASGTLTAEDYTFNYVNGTLTVKAVVVERIEITAPPAKTAYMAGETFDAAGMEVRAYYNDGSDGIVSNYTFVSDALAPGTTAVEIAYGGKTATVAITVELPELEEHIVFGDASVAYDGQTHSLEASELPDGVTVEYLIDGMADNAAKDAGMYVVTARFTVTDGSAVIKDKTATLTIAPRGLTAELLDGDSLIEDGTEKRPQIILNGLVDGDDAGLTVTYDRTPVAAGHYTARLAIADPNYVLAADTLGFDVRRGAVSGALDGSEKPGVIVEGESGFKADTEVKITPVTDEKEIGAVSSAVDGKLNYLYDISLSAGGQNYKPDGKVTVKVLIGDKTLFYKDLHVYRYEADGTYTDMNAVRDGEYMGFETEHFSRYAIVTLGESGGLPPAVIGAIVGGAVLLVAAAVVIIVLQMKKKHRQSASGVTSVKSVKKTGTAAGKPAQADIPRSPEPPKPPKTGNHGNQR